MTLRWTVPLLVALTFSACASRPHVHAPAPHPAPNAPVYVPSRHGPAPQPVNSPRPGPQVQYGRVAAIDVVPARQRTTGSGAVVGGLIGAVVGRQIGAANDAKGVGTVVGAISGALIGNEIEASQRDQHDHVRVTIRTDRGALMTLHYAQIVDLRVGDRVRIVGNQVYRL